MNILNTHTHTNFGYFPEILILARTQRKEMSFESYSHLNILEKYPTFLVHGLEYFVILNAHFARHSNISDISPKYLWWEAHNHCKSQHCLFEKECCGRRHRELEPVNCNVRTFTKAKDRKKALVYSYFAKTVQFLTFRKFALDSALERALKKLFDVE